MPPTHPVYQRVVGVVKKIVDSNQDLEFMRQQTWTILVIDSKEVNAFVLPACTVLFYLANFTLELNSALLEIAFSCFTVTEIKLCLRFVILSFCIVH